MGVMVFPSGPPSRMDAVPERAASISVFAPANSLPPTTPDRSGLTLWAVPVRQLPPRIERRLPSGRKL